MNGDGDVVSGMAEQASGCGHRDVMPAEMLAEQHRKMAEPGSAKK